MKRSLFLDTSAWFAALAASQEHHALCHVAYREALIGNVPLVTTSLVVAEMHVLLSRRVGLAFAQRFLAVLDDAQHEVVCPDADLLKAASTRWIRRYADQPFSLCDAVSFEVMRTRKLTTALALDHHFRVAGFATVPDQVP